MPAARAVYLARQHHEHGPWRLLHDAQGSVPGNKLVSGDECHRTLDHSGKVVTAYAAGERVLHPPCRVLLLPWSQLGTPYARRLHDRVEH